MGAFLGVAAASDSPPKFIHLKYSPKGEPKRKLVIIGKGVSRRGKRAILTRIRIKHARLCAYDEEKCGALPGNLL